MVPSRRLCDVLFLGLHDCNIAVVLVVALPPMSEVSGFAYAFVAQMEHVYFGLACRLLLAVGAERVRLPMMSLTERGREAGWSMKLDTLDGERELYRYELPQSTHA